MAETIEVGVEKKSQDKEVVGGNDLAAWMVGPASLVKAVENARKFLNRGRTAAESGIAFVGGGIGVIGDLKNASFEDRKAGAALKKESRLLIEQLIRQLSDITIDVTEARGRRYSDILAHYRASELADDKTLAQEFENYRAEYVKSPTDGATCNRYGWMLHDCLKAAYGRLHNAKLTEFFKKEFEAWHYQGPDKLRDAKLAQCRLQDIKKADAFLNGPREALILLAAGEWVKAKKSADAYLVSNPGNAAALEVVLRACEKSTAFDEAAAMVKTASAAIKWHPDELAFQQWFVKAINKAIGAIFAAVPNSDESQKVQLASGVCGELVRQCCSDFSFLSLLTPGTRDYSRVLFVVVAASEIIFRQHLALNGLLAELAPQVIAFVRAWGLNNFMAEDKDEPSENRRRYSLAGRTVIMLLKYCEYDVPETDVKWALHVSEEFQYLFKRDLTGLLNAVASLYHSCGNEEASRRFAIDLVRWNQTEGWRWMVLARTYSKGSQERSDCLIRANSKCEQDCAEANRRAELLLQGETSKIAGVILARFKDKVSQVDMVRVWWRDPMDGEPYSDFASFTEVTGLESCAAGTPVTVSVVAIGRRRKMVGLAPRLEGTLWDIYPFCDAIVIVRNDARHFVKIMYGAGKTCSADPRKIGALTQLHVGDSCKVAVWEREGQPSVALAVKMVEGSRLPLAFCREYAGVLRRTKCSRDGMVGEVAVPPEARGTVHFETQVNGWAVMAGDANLPSWRAITCKPFNDLEVLQ